MTSPSPGWYPDPHVAQQMRWWDGERWSEDTYERTEPMVDWAAGGPTQQQGQQGQQAQQAQRMPQAAQRAEARPVPTTDDGAVLANWWPRAAARVIDLVITGLLAWAIGFRQSRVFVESFASQMDAALRAAQQGSDAPAYQYDLATVKALTVLSLIWLAVSLVYQMVFLLWRGATPGKLALGLRVRRWTPGERLTPGAVALRWLGCEGVSAVPYVGNLYLLADSLWPLRDARRQALHDKYAGTCVVRAR